MKTASSISLALFMTLSTASHGAGQTPYTLAYSDNPPFSTTQNARPQGVAINIISLLFGKAGLPYTFLEVPLTRAMISAKTTANYCVFPVQRSQAIEADYQWVSPILITRSGLFVRPDNTRQFVTLNDAKRLTIGVLRGSGDAEYLRNFGFTIEEANTQEQNLDKLFARRFDVWATDVLSANFFLQKSGNKDKTPKQALTFRATLSSLACNINMPTADTDKLQEALDGMIKDGTLQKLTMQ